MNRTKEVTRQQPCEASRCPLCGAANDCSLCITDTAEGPCWCEAVEIPEGLMARVPAVGKESACICERCVTAFHQEGATTHQPASRAGVHLANGKPA
jgi:hypothetical protein